MAANDDSPLVLVTGGTGFLASHIIQQLQQDGYRVRASLRGADNEEKTKPLHELCPEAEHKLELVEAELTNADVWENVVKDCTYVLHVAGPFPGSGNITNEDDIMKPAVEGMGHILKACSKEKVRRLVITSSLVAVTGNASTVDASKTYTEEDWADAEKITDVYIKSKILSEKAAWDFVKEQPEEEKLEIAVVNPSFVAGPVLFEKAPANVEVVKKLLERGVASVPKLFFPIVDVRDVAAAHIKAMTTPEAAGQRHILYGTGLWMKEMAQHISKEFKPQGYNVPTLHCPYFAMFVRSLFDKNTKTLLPNIGKAIKVENAKMKDTLGVTPREVQETLVDMCYSLIEKGLAKKSKKYRGPKKEGENEEKEEATENHVEEAKEANGTVSTGGDETKEEVKEKEDNETEKPAEGDEKEEKPADPAAEEKKEEEKTEAPPAEAKTEEAPAEDKKEESTEAKTEDKPEEKTEASTEESAEK